MIRAVGELGQRLRVRPHDLPYFQQIDLVGRINVTGRAPQWIDGVGDLFVEVVAYSYNCVVPSSSTRATLIGLFIGPTPWMNGDCAYSYHTRFSSGSLWLPGESQIV